MMSFDASIGAPPTIGLLSAAGAVAVFAAMVLLAVLLDIELIFERFVFEFAALFVPGCAPQPAIKNVAAAVVVNNKFNFISVS